MKIQMGSSSPSKSAVTSQPNTQKFTQVVDGSSSNGTFQAEEKKPDVTKNSGFSNLLANLDKFKKYEADYTKRLMAKYFSKKNVYGDDIFEDETTIDGEVIKSSRWPCTLSYADPLKTYEGTSGTSSASSDEAPSSTSNGKPPLKKNG